MSTEDWKKLRQKTKGQREPPSVASSASPEAEVRMHHLTVRVTSSTYHLSQVALRELRLRLRLELPDFPQENLLVELGTYGAFDVRVGNTLLCETSSSVIYPPVSNIVAELARIIASSTGTDQQQPQQPQLWDGYESPLGSRTSSSSLTSLDFNRYPSDLHSLMCPDGGPEDPDYGGLPR